ncbi:hypothetical protein chiPu_0024841 [Chiloscyllium punctatum]|uniref:Uncharacterized protein n=1 Tax=Chiloscyllium punctatum TaxID=137246 RepID=A0A401TDU6_CHIPU|nr:hypothetical protein [Chiloscyllium punctatum]
MPGAPNAERRLVIDPLDGAQSGEGRGYRWAGRGGLRGQEQQQERIDAYRVEAELREPEPSPGTNLQHISDREAPEGESGDTARLVGGERR